MDKEIKKDKKEYNKLKKEYKETLKREYDKWKQYKKAFDNGAEDFFSYNWTDSYVQQLKKTINEIDKGMKQINKLKFDDLTEKDIESISDLGNTITSYMKDTYDHKTDAMEMIWFEYGDILEDTWDVASQGNEVKVRMQNNINEKEKSEKKINDYNEEQKKTEDKLDKIEE